MKKCIQLFVICCLTIIFLNNQAVLSHCGRHLSLLQESEATKISPNNNTVNQLINNDIVWFYPEDSIVMAYVDLTKANIDKIQTIINSQMDPEKPSKELKDVSKIFDILGNFTLSFGPDLTFGMIKQLEENKVPPVFMAVRVKVDNFSIDSVASILGGKDGKLQKETFNGIEIHRYKGKSNDLIFATLDNYLLASENEQIIKLAIDNYKSHESNFLSNPDALKAVKYLPNNAIGLALTDNIELSKVMPEKKDKKEEKADKTTDEKVLPEENENTEKSDEDVAEDNTEENTSPCDADKEKKEDKKPDIFQVYLKKIQQTNSYTATALFLQNNAIGIKSYTPYDLTFLDSFNPKLKKSIVNMLQSGKYYDVAKSLPSDVAGYFLISNLAGVTDILQNIDDEDFQKGFASIKVMFSTMTGIDFEKQFVPMFSGQTTIAVMKGEENPEPLVLLSKNDQSFQTLDQLLTVFHKMEPDVDIKDKKIKKEMFTIISLDKLPIDIAFGNINGAITFGNFEIVETIAKYAQKAKKFLTVSDTYKDFAELNHEPCNAAIYVEFEKLKEVFGDEFTKDFPEEIQQVFKSMYISIANQKDNVFQITILMQLH